MHTLALIFAVTAAVAVGPTPLPLHDSTQELPTPTLLPWPAHYASRSGHAAIRLPLEPQIFAPVSGGDPRVQAAISLLQNRLWAQPSAASTLEKARPPQAATLSIAWRVAGLTPQALGEDESYVLDVTQTQVTLTAQTPLGVLRGLQTLEQLVESGTQPGEFLIPCVSVTDAPRFAWRGVMLDVARHFLPVTDIKRQLTAMAAVKFNVLHWHLSDDQGFRVESHVYPELHRQGGGGEYYTQAQVREVVAFAAERGIRVVPEFDMPGHTDSWLLGYPELAAGAAPKRLASTWGIFDSVLDPTKPSTYAFIDALLGEMTQLFPDAYLHIGGDENTGKHWAASATIQDFMKAQHLTDTAALQTYFVARVQKLAQGHGRNIVGWDEILNEGLAPEAVVQSWRGGQSLVAAIEQGHPAILSSGYYLSDNPAETSSVEAHYLNDPAAAWTGDDPDNLLGGEVCQWSELVPPHLLDVTLWPRAAAVAERLWSPAGVRDVLLMHRRLAAQAVRLTALGVAPPGAQQQLIAALMPGRDVAPLLILADALVARRANWWPNFKQKRPLHSFADALPTESPLARDLHVDVDQLLDPNQDALARGAAAQRADQALADIIANGLQVAALVAGSGQLADAAFLNREVVAVASLGREALAQLAGPPGSEAALRTWLAAAAATLMPTGHRDVGAEVAFAKDMGRLVSAVAQNHVRLPSQP